MLLARKPVSGRKDEGGLDRQVRDAAYATQMGINDTDGRYRITLVSEELNETSPRCPDTFPDTFNCGWLYLPSMTRQISGSTIDQNIR